MEYFEKLNEVFGDNVVVTCERVSERHMRFSEGHAEVEDYERTGRHVTAKNRRKTLKIYETVLKDQRQSFRMIAGMDNTNDKTVRSILHNEFDSTQVCQNGHEKFHTGAKRQQEYHLL